MPNEDPNKKSFESSHLMSPAPGVPQTPTKAIASAVVSAVVVALTAYFTGDNDIDVQGIVAAVVSGVVVGLSTYLTKNKLKARDERGDASSLIVTVVVIVVAVFLALVLFNRCDGDRDHDSKKGQDWERAPIAQTFESSHK